MDDAGKKPDDAPEGVNANDLVSNSLLFVGVLVGVIVIVGSLVVVASYLSPGDDISPQIALPVLAISGVVLLLGTLSIVSIAFTLFGIEDPKQALGLPEGSIRAVIALSLVVLFGIFSVYLYGNMARPGVDTVQGLSADDARNFVANLPKGQLMADVSKDVFGADNKKTGEVHTVYFKNSSSPESVDFAKQLLTLIGTLVTALVSFYFGSKTTAPPTP
jgi:hypothetical protein